MLFVVNSDNMAMRRPGKTSVRRESLNTDYVATPSTTRRKGKLTEQHVYSLC